MNCFTRGGYDWADRYPQIVKAALSIRADAFLLDGELAICGDDAEPTLRRCAAADVIRMQSYLPSTS